MILPSKFLANMHFKRAPTVQRFRNHPPVSPKTLGAIKDVFMSNLREKWLVDVGDDKHLISTHPSLLIAIERFADSLLTSMHSFVASNKKSNGGYYNLYATQLIYEQSLADNTAFAVAQLRDQRDILGFDFDVDYMAKQVFFEVAAKYQATFNENVVVNKAFIDPMKSQLWLDRVNIRNNEAAEYLSL